MLYSGQALLERWHDGDSCELTVTMPLPLLGDVTTVARRMMRLRGINCPELRTTFGPAAKAFSQAHCPPGLYAVEVNGWDKYGRWLGTVFVNGKDITTLLVESGNAERVKYGCELEE